MPNDDLDDYDFDLPHDRIAQEPAASREASRALFTERGAADSEVGSCEVGVFQQIVDRVHGDEVFVVNNTRVIPARLHAERSTGGRIECFVLERDSGGAAKAWLSPSKRLQPGEVLRIAGTDEEIVLGERAGRVWTIELPVGALEAHGDVPLPPYIERSDNDPRGSIDRDRYQTVYARNDGAVAAPTAGLHFTPELMAALEGRGCVFVEVTLHVGPGTFEPVHVTRLVEHRVSAERIEVTPHAHQALQMARSERRPIVAVGTTSVRTLESLPTVGEGEEPTGFSGETDVTILPGHEFQNVDGLITNFHLPRSSLLVLVSAFHGRERTLVQYRHAIEAGLRFYSYGDAMVIAPRRSG